MTTNALVEEAFAHHSAGRLDLAEALYRQVLGIDEDNLHVILLLGALTCDSGRAAEAVALLERAAASLQKRGEQSVRHAALYNNLGNALKLAGRSADAIASYRYGLTLDPKIAELHGNLAGELGKQGDLAGAAAGYETAVHLRSDRADWVHSLASTYATMGVVESAVTLYRRALALEPRRSESLRALALALISLGRHSEAIEPLAQLAADHPDKASFHSELGSAQFGAKQLDAALASFEQVLMLRPDDAEAHSTMGSILHAQGKPDEAEKSYRRALQLKPDLAGVLFNLGLLLHREREKPAEAIALFERLTAIAPNHIEAHYALGNAFRSLARVDNAVESYRRYVERLPNSALAHLVLGQTLSEAGQKEEAIAIIEKALTLNPDHALAHLAHLAFGNALLDFGRTKEAHSHFKQALLLQPLVTRKAAKANAVFTVLLVLVPHAHNTPYEYLIDQADYDSHVLLLLPGVEYDVAFLASRCDVVVNLVSDVDQDKAMLPMATSLIDRLAKPVINHPTKISSTDRESISTLLSSIPSCRVPKVERHCGAALISPGFLESSAAPPMPFLARLVGRHGGDEFEMIEAATDLEKLISCRPAEDYYLIEYLDYRSADGFFRKYRFFFVGNEMLPYHLAIGAQWKVHHFRTDMANHPWMQREEEAFLGAPEAVFGPRHFAALRAIRAAVGLEFFGIDCSLDRDGNIVVFEANASMLVHGNNSDFPYKTPYVRRIKAAFEAMLAKAALVLPCDSQSLSTGR